MQKSVFVKKDSVDLETENYFVVDPDTGNKNMNDKSAFIQQLADIMAALEQSLHKNNLFLDIKFDAVSLGIAQISLNSNPLSFYDSF